MTAAAGVTCVKLTNAHWPLLMEGAGAVLCSLLFGDCDASSLLYAHLTSLDVLSLLQSCRALHHLISSGGPSVQMLLTRLLAKRAVASNFIDWDRAVVKVEIRPSCLNDFDCLRSLSASEQSVGDKVVCCPRVQQSGSVRRGLSDACLLHSSSGSTLVAAVYNCNRLHVECGYGVTDGFASATRSYDLQCFPHTESDDSPPISCVELRDGVANGVSAVHTEVVFIFFNDGIES